MAAHLQDQQGVRLAIEGCGHGTLHAIYASVEAACKEKGWHGIDLLIIGGDFESIRNAYDLNCVSMPAKYREMCDFHEYYSGQRLAPYLTIFVGGNHEASNYLFELYYGGWVAPNIYYMGAANVLRLGPLRIAGMSGIWKGFDYRKPHFERLPYNQSDIKSIYHVREMDMRKLLQIQTQVDIGISHDWPQGVEWKGNWKQLFRFKSHFEDDARTGRLGSVAAKQVLDRLRPKYWFSAHLHCKYAAVIAHDDKGRSHRKPQHEANGTAHSKHNADEIGIDNEEHSVTATAGPKNENEIDLDLDDDAAPSEIALRLNTAATAAAAMASKNSDEIDLEIGDDEDETTPTAPIANGSSAVPQGSESSDPVLAEARAALPASFGRPSGPEPIEHPPEIINAATNFLALDKCLPNRHFLQLIEVPITDEVELSRPYKLQYDTEWLAITRTFAVHEPVPFGDINATVPRAKTQAEYRELIVEQQKWISENLAAQDFSVPENFVITAPEYDGGHFQDAKYQQAEEYPNPQIAQFCELLKIQNPLAISEEDRAARIAAGARPEDERSFHGGGSGGPHRGRMRGGRGGRGRGRGGRFRGR